MPQETRDTNGLSPAVTLQHIFFVFMVQAVLMLGCVFVRIIELLVNICIWGGTNQ